MKLNERQEKFCHKYIECGVATEAMLYAYPSRKSWKKAAIEVAASKILKNGKVMVRVDELRAELRSRSDITKERILNELSKIAFSSIGDMHTNWDEVVDFERLTTDQKAAIRSISARIVRRQNPDNPDVIESVNIELYDKIKAIERICRMLGFDSPTELNVNKGDDGMRYEDMLKEIERLEKLRKND